MFFVDFIHSFMGFNNFSMISTTCDPVNCYEPAIPAFGKIIAKHFTYGSVANYSCVYGYMLVGNPSVVCEADGTWEGDMPTCVPVDCGDPEVRKGKEAGNERKSGR